MKSGNKALLIFVAVLFAYVAAGLFLAPREGAPKETAGDVELPTGNERGVYLANAQDSMSYAVSMMVASDMPRAIRELGITDSTIDNFVMPFRQTSRPRLLPTLKALLWAHQQWRCLTRPMQ